MQNRTGYFSYNFCLCCSQHQQVRRQWEQGAALHLSQSAPDLGEAPQSDKGTIHSTVVPNLKSIFISISNRDIRVVLTCRSLTKIIILTI